MSLDTKVRRIQLARLCALAAISLMWIDGERSCAMTIPISRFMSLDTKVRRIQLAR